jgi:hypothetical protein
LINLNKIACIKEYKIVYLIVDIKENDFMSTLTVRISDSSRTTLRELAAKEKASMQAILDKALESYRRQLFLAEVNKAYAALRQDPKAWAQVEKERAEWDAALGDGLEPGDEGTENGKMIRKERRKRRG